MAAYRGTDSNRGGTGSAAAGAARTGGHGTLTLAAGALTVVIGLLILIWPGPTVVVIAWLLAVQLIVAGVLQLVAAFMEAGGTAGRVLLCLLGALSILVGLLCLRAPLQTALVIGLLIGATWVVSGVIGVVTAIGSGQREGRGWGIVSGVVSTIAGAVVLVFPEASVVALTWLLGIGLVVTGIAIVAAGLAARRSSRTAAAA